MISIRKFLDARSAVVVTSLPASEAPLPLFKLLSSVLSSINKYVLVDESSDHARSQLAQLSDGLRRDVTPPEVATAEVSITRILKEHRETSQRKVLGQGLEMQHIFAMLNQALTGLAESSGRSVGGLTKIQGLLERATTIGDIVALKSALESTLEYVKVESLQASSAEVELGRFEAEMTKSREFLWGTRMKLAGRPEGVAKITEGLSTLDSGEALYAIAYHFHNRVQAVTTRYGPEVAEELTFCLIRERIEPIAPVDATYRWTPSSLVAVFAQPRDLASLRTKVTLLNRNPVVHRIALGSRTAILTIAPSHLVTEGLPGTQDELIEKVDRFTAAQG